jgi:autotransporter passenger strand-loop-strand repeat protein
MLLAGGSVSSTTIDSGGMQVVYGTASGSRGNFGGYDLVGSGGAAIGTTVTSDSEYVPAGGTVSGTTVSSGEEVIFGTASGTVLNNGAAEYVSSGAVVKRHDGQQRQH